MQEKYSQNTFFLIRHGEAENNVLRILDGHRKGGKVYALTECGKRQVGETAKFLESFPVDFIITSPIKRARETAEIIRDALQVPLSYDERLCEARFGSFEGTDIDHFLDFMRKHMGRNIGDPERGVEGFMDIRERIQSFLREVSEHFEEKNIVVVSHGDPIQEMYGELMEIPEGVAQTEKSWYPKQGSCMIVSKEGNREFIPKS